ncbi:kinase-like protein [Auricularia subglabra TFB-10046 SS5]|uniref:Kinase-like protein n=1 Tax=Auricularia subglabra (strain TFB-10046 / SS5) TaxID=717982 RepID=J0DA24_AURST|nr:kinase-like protein [Auricularia subglabra TFB-10046 SS5]
MPSEYGKSRPSRRKSTDRRTAPETAGESVLVKLVDGTGYVKIRNLRSALRGGHATILRGTLSGAQVALKLPHLLSTVQRELLRRELKSWRRVRHPHVLPLLGIYDDGLQLGLMTMWLVNGHLLRYIRENDKANVNRLIREVAEGLNYLHIGARIVHGDLKCENVLISESGHAQLADFGLSTVIDKEPDDRTTATKIREQSSLAFSAPELLVDAVYDIRTVTSDDSSTTSSVRRKRSKTVETDVYAYGMLILQAFTGQPPWHAAQNVMQLCMQVLKGARPPHPGPAAQQRGLAGIVWTICNQCWESKPQLRPRMPDIILMFTTSKPVVRERAQLASRTPSIRGKRSTTAGRVRR